MTAHNELDAAQYQATRFFREYYEDPKAWGEFAEIQHQGLRPLYLFVGYGPTVREHKRVQVAHLLGQLWTVEFAD